MTDRLDTALHAMGLEVDFPATPDARATVERIVRTPARRWWMPAAWPRALVLAILVTLLVAATATAVVIAVPGLRLTILDALPGPEVPDEPLATRLALGDPVAPDSVAVGVPSALGSPDEAYVLGDHRVLSLVYAAGDDLPELGNSGIGILIQVIEGALDRERVEKLTVESGNTVTAVEVNGSDGYWIEGPPHLVRFIDSEGTEWSTRTRLAGDTLIWERGGVLYRIESGLGLEETLRVAETIEP